MTSLGESPTPKPLYAFFFREDTERFDGLDAIREVFKELRRQSDFESCEIRIGSVMISQMAYRQTSVSAGMSPRQGVGARREADRDLFVSLVRDFAESCTTLWSTADEDTLTVTFSQENIYCISAVGLDTQSAKRVAHALKDRMAFYGACSVDVGNPHLRLLLYEWLIPFCRLQGNLVTFLGYDSLDYFDTGWLDELDLSISPTVDPNIYALPQQEDSRRGAQSRRLLTTMAVPTHGEQVTRALAETWEEQKLQGQEFHLSAANSGPPSVETTKLVGYLLSEVHPKGQHKARVFKAAFSITAEHQAYLAEQLTMGLRRATLRRARKGVYGVQYEADIPVRGVNGAVKLVQSAWVFKDDAAPKLTTAYVIDTPPDADLSAVTDIPFVLESDDTRWEEVWAIAHKAGMEAANRCIPTPMILRDAYGDRDEGATYVESEGMCGGAWVEVADGRSSFSRWFRRKKGSQFDSKRIGSAHQSQSVDRNRAYCEAFARVLRMNNVPCRVKSYLT